MKVAGFCVKCGVETGGKRRRYCQDCRPRGKFKNKIVTTADGTFHSKKEHDRWLYLKSLAKAKVITELKHHVPYKLVVNGVLIGRYTCDAQYWAKDHYVVEDVKSERTRKLNDYILRKKLMKALYNIEITEI